MLVHASPWFRPYEADVRRIAEERGMGRFAVAFVHHPMKANTAGEGESLSLSLSLSLLLLLLLLLLLSLSLSL